MGVMRPDHRLRSVTARFQNMDKCLEHMGVAQIPGFGAAVVHDAIVALGGRDQPCVLRRIDEAVRVVLHIIKVLAKQGLALLDDCLLALSISFRQYRAYVPKGRIIRRYTTPFGRSAGQFSEAIRTLVRAMEAVSAYVLFAGGRLNGLVPVAQFNQFEHLDQPAVQPRYNDDPGAFWDKFSGEFELKGIRRPLAAYNVSRPLRQRCEAYRSFNRAGNDGFSFPAMICRYTSHKKNLHQSAASR